MQLSSLSFSLFLEDIFLKHVINGLKRDNAYNQVHASGSIKYVNLFPSNFSKSDKFQNSIMQHIVSNEQRFHQSYTYHILHLFNL